MSIERGVTARSCWLARVGALSLVCGLLGGCPSRQVRLPSGPDASANVRVANAPDVGLAPVRDVRPNEGAGYVGALKLTAGAELKAYLQSSATRALTRSGYNVVSTPDPSAAHGEGRSFKGREVVLTVQGLSLWGEGLAPVQAAATFTAQVYDESATIVYSQMFRGSANDVFGLTAHPDVLAGKIMAGALDQAVANMVADSRFLAAIR